MRTTFRKWTWWIASPVIVVLSVFIPLVAFAQQNPAQPETDPVKGMMAEYEAHNTGVLRRAAMLAAELTAVRAELAKAKEAAAACKPEEKK